MSKTFTLIEMMVVIAIIAVLSVIIGSQAFNAVRKANDGRVETDFRSIKTAAMAYNVDTGNWPANANTLGFVHNDGQPSWQGPYLERWPAGNPWSGNYTWVNDSSGTFTASGINERYITTNSVPGPSAVRIDRDLDDSNAATGMVRYNNGTGVLSLSVSYDVN